MQPIPGTDRSPADDLGPAGRPPARVLVAYASKHGSTQEIAEAIGAELRGAGIGVEVVPAGRVRSLDDYDAVILGSGLYSATWLREANRFVRARAEALAARPTWLFSSGPLDQSARWSDIPMTPHVAEVAAGIGIRGHRTFGGRLLEGVSPLDAAGNPTHRTGDFRDWDAIRAWAREIASELG